MYGPQLMEMAQVAEQEHMRAAMMARCRAEERREARAQRGPGRFKRAWVAFWAPRDFVLVRRTSVSDGGSADLAPCTDC